MSLMGELANGVFYANATNAAVESRTLLEIVNAEIEELEKQIANRRELAALIEKDPDIERVLALNGCIRGK